MGCSPSSSAAGARGRNAADEHPDSVEWLERLLASGDPRDLLAAYVEVERSILNEESGSPASVLNVAASTQQHLKSLMESATERREGNSDLLPHDDSIHELFADLGLHRSPEAAAEHEEFVANVNRKELARNLVEILGRRTAAAEEAARNAALGVGRLQLLYERQDLLLGRIYGDAYGSEKERLLEEEIDRMRNYRDTFSGGALHWQESARNVAEAAELLLGGVAAWRAARGHRTPEKMISAAAEARNAVQEAVLLVRLSHDSLPGVEFPYCTRRELAAVSQATEYAFTDLAIESRYRHALRVYENFRERAASLSRWINQVLDSTLKKDLADIDRRIFGVSRRLRHERMRIIGEKLGIENGLVGFEPNPAAAGARAASPETAYLRDPVPTEGDVTGGNRGAGSGRTAPGRAARVRQAEASPRLEFERNLAARRVTMWPSRRIEELRTLAFGGSLP